MGGIAAVNVKKDENGAPLAVSPRNEQSQIHLLPNQRHRLDRFFARLAPVLADLFLIFLNALTVIYLWSVSISSGHVSLGGSSFLYFGGHPYVSFLMVYAVLILLLLKAEDLYKSGKVFSGLRELALVAAAVGVTTLLLIGVTYSSGITTIPWTVICSTGALNVLALSGWRIGRRSYRQRRLAGGIGFRNAVIVGADGNGQVLARYLDANPHLGYVVKGFVDPDSHADPRLLGRVEELEEIVTRLFIDDVFVAAPSQREILDDILQKACRQRFDVKVIPQCLTGANGGSNWAYVGNFATLVLHEESIPALGLFVKRTLDILLALLGLLLSLPFMAVVALAIKLDSPGPIIYRSWRIGKKGNRFLCHKFRTMVDNAHELKEQFLHLNERDGPLFKIAEDPRLTGIGGFLRKYSLDEVPQFLDVLLGNMSLVGPRPALPEELKQYRPEHLRRLQVTPGLTGLWQVTARNDPSFDTYMGLDLHYVANWSLGLDLRILLRTVPAVLRAEGR